MECCNNKVSLLSKISSLFNKNKSELEEANQQYKKIALIGSPNVGKSVIFNSLTGAYVTVSNYPGTTVEISKGWYNTNGEKIQIMDTPGMYSMVPITEEERVTRQLLMQESPDMVLHVVDAKNIERMLPLTLQLIEAGFNAVLVLNIMDEAKALGININCRELEKLLGIPVVTASAALNQGLNDIKDTIKEHIKNAA